MWLPLKNINIKMALIKNIGLVNCDYKLIFGCKYMHEHFSYFSKVANIFNHQATFVSTGIFFFKKKNSDSQPNDVIRALNQENQV